MESVSVSSGLVHGKRIEWMEREKRVQATDAEAKQRAHKTRKEKEREGNRQRECVSVRVCVCVCVVGEATTMEGQGQELIGERVFFY